MTLNLTTVGRVQEVEEDGLDGCGRRGKGETWKRKGRRIVERVRMDEDGERRERSGKGGER